MATGVASSVTQTPKLRNFATMKRFVVNVVQGGTDDEMLDAAGLYINAGIDALVNSRTWNWSLRRHDITTVASQSDYSINANWKKPRALHLLNTSSLVAGRLAWKMPKAFWDEHTMTQSDATPSRYTVESPTIRGKLVIDPAPTSDWVDSYPTMRHHYYSRSAHLSQDSDAIEAPPEIWHLIVFYARDLLARDRGINSTKEEHAWKQLYGSLISDDNDELTDWEV